MQASVRIALGVCFALYVAIAAAASAAFGMEVDKNILISLASPLGLTLLPESLVAAVVRCTARDAHSMPTAR